MNSAATASSQNRARKIRGLLLALLALDDDASGVVGSHLRDRTFGHAEPVVKHGTCGYCHGTGCLRCDKGVIEYTERDPYLEPRSDDTPASLPPATRSLGSSFASPTERAAQTLMRRRASLGSTVPHLERAVDQMREERPDLHAHLSSAGCEVIAWLSDALTGLPINCPRWARSNH